MLQQPACFINIPDTLEIPDEWDLSELPEPMELDSVSADARSKALAFGCFSGILALFGCVCMILHALAFGWFLVGGGLVFAALSFCCYRLAIRAEQDIVSIRNENKARLRLQRTREAQAKYRRHKDRKERERDAKLRNQRRILLDHQLATGVIEHIKSGTLAPYAPPIVLKEGEECVYYLNASLGEGNEPGAAKPSDGLLVMTNRRVVFVGEGTNASVPLKDILSIKLDDEGSSVKVWVEDAEGPAEFGMDHPNTFMAYAMFAFKSAGLVPPAPVN